MKDEDEGCDIEYCMEYISILNAFYGLNWFYVYTIDRCFFVSKKIIFLEINFEDEGFFLYRFEIFFFVIGHPI
jgi:hypothetical protein